MALVSFAQAHAHVRPAFALEGSPNDPQVEDFILKMEAATAIVLDYLKRPIGAWEAGSPGSPGGGSPADDQQLTVVQIAVLLVLAHLWSHRGDEIDESAKDGPITPAVERLLWRLRDPALA